MTAEVAIMNKLGLALAADSAITSGRDGFKKVYNTANKLFSLTENHPIGVMVYGSASFMEVPWEVIIKSYRSTLLHKKFDSAADYFEDFKAFLTGDDRFKAGENERIIVYRSFSDKLKNLLIDVEDRMEEENQEELTDQVVSEWLQEYVEREIKELEQLEEIFIEMEFDQFLDSFRSVLDEIIEELIAYKLPQNLIDDLYLLGFQLLQKDFFSRGSTGIVFAGYGEKEIFPHLLEYRLEGFLFGQLKYKKLQEKKIHYTNGKDGKTAAVIPFAQQEMVHSFMNGIEPVLEETYYEIIQKVTMDYHNQIADQLDISFSDEQVSKLEKMGKDLYTSVADSVQDYQSKYYIEPLLGIVRSLPKEELADMAEALVNLTSFKRRVSRDTESVGGPVDVAVITKGDGFVWVKRKSYFDPDLNPMYLTKLMRGDRDHDGWR